MRFEEFKGKRVEIVTTGDTTPSLIGMVIRVMFNGDGALHSMTLNDVETGGIKRGINPELQIVVNGHNIIWVVDENELKEAFG